MIIYLCFFASRGGAFPVASHGKIDAETIYMECGLRDFIQFEVFEHALTGFEKISGLKNQKIITIIDYSKPSVQERFFVIDLERKKILYRTWVSHGKNSGGNVAENFSNKSNSLKSSLGFFITAEAYHGKYGYSLRLDGLEPGINDNARSRNIVIHGADYVGREIARQYGQLGKSWGCPALPPVLTKKIIDAISEGSCLFIYGNDDQYFRNSKMLNN